jgi:two-component system response regulator RegX3
MQHTPRLLVVDDEEAILEFVSFNLKREGYEVVVASDGDAALELAAAQAFDLVILDIMLPGTDGFEVCRRLRATGDVPVLFLSARDTELDKVVGLEIGGDDYLAKPFGIRELQARVKALLRRAATAPRPTGAGSPVAGERFEAGGIALDEGSHDVEIGGAPLDLTPREFELLACLMRHAGKVLSRDQLLRQAWGWEIVVETKTVDTHVKRLRDKLERAGADPNIVETVRGYGYRLNP